MEELKAIVCQAQDIIRSLPVEERASGTDAASLDPTCAQVSSVCLAMPSVLGKYVLVSVNSRFIFICSFLIQTGSSEQVQINPASTQTGSK